MGSRIRHCGHVFDGFFMVSPPVITAAGERKEARVVHKYPLEYHDEEVLKSIGQFVYPTEPLACSETVIHYSFVLTSLDSKWTFGFCRHSAEVGSQAILLLSSLPWHDLFYKILNHIYLLSLNKDNLHLSKFLEALYNASIPEPGLPLHVFYYVNAKEYEFKGATPDHRKLPSIPEDRNLTEYYNAVEENNMIVIFASMLQERRILMCSKKLSRLSSCVQAANTLIYPMHWQHIFIPVLPIHLLDYLSAPMPFLIGVPKATLQRVKPGELGDVVILDCDENRVESPFDDLHALPNEVVNSLKRSLKNSANLLGDGVSRTFLKALVMLIGGYRDALKFTPGQKITFCNEAFIGSRQPPIQTFLQKMLHLQIFQQFVEGRLAMLHEGEGFSDEFEFELNMYEDRSTHRLKTQYKEWLGAMRKEGGALLKSVNPAMKSAYRQVRKRGKVVRDRGKKAYKDIRNKIQEYQKPGDSIPVGNSGIRSPGSPSGSSSSRHSSISGSQACERLKKSVSGVLVSKTDKTTTYIRKRSSENGTAIRTENGNDPLIRLDSIKGPENSLEESNTSTSGLNSGSGGEESLYCYDPINMDLMGDLQDLIFKDCSLKGAETNNMDGFEAKNSNTTNSFQLSRPIAPPRSSEKDKTRWTRSSPEKSLIQLDSPPDDVESLFDPLKASSSGGQNSGSVSLRHSVGVGRKSSYPADLVAGFPKLAQNPFILNNGRGFYRSAEKEPMSNFSSRALPVSSPYLQYGNTSVLNNSTGGGQNPFQNVTYDQTLGLPYNVVNSSQKNWHLFEN